jgi:predicted nucleotidyltransferase
VAEAERLADQGIEVTATGLICGPGPVDLLGTIGNNLGYADLLARSNEMDIGERMRIRVLDLETIIAIKEQLGSKKDLAALPNLYHTLRQMKKSV